MAYPDGTSRADEYDPAGNPTTIIDPRGNTISQSFDAGDRLTGRIVTPSEGQTLEGDTAEPGRLVITPAGDGAIDA